MKAGLFMLTFLSASLLLSTGAAAQKTRSLFNGKDLSNWRFILDERSSTPEKTFMVKEGCICITGKPSGYMYTTDSFGDCIVHAEWRWPDGKAADSGIFVLLTDPQTDLSAVQCNLMAGNAGSMVAIDVALAEHKSDPNRSSSVQFLDKYRKSSEKPAGEWNEANIFIIDGVLTVYVNGILQNIGTGTKKAGAIGLQSEGGEIQFRNVTVTPFD